MLRPDGRLLEASGGLADPAHGLPNAAATRFRIGSLSKSFTAAALLRLVDAGRLDLQAPVARFFPRLPHAAEITPLQLLEHRAGLANYTAQPDYWPMRMRLPHTPAQLIDWLHELAPLRPPGERVAYSNTAYVLLAAIVERVAEQDFSEFRRRELFEPLGLSSLAADDGRCLLAGAARGLHHDGRWSYAEPMDMSVAWGAFDLVANAGDLCRWLVGLPRLLSPASADLMLDVSQRELSCGLAAEHWMLGGQPRRVAGHFSDVNGFFAQMARLPQGGAVAVLFNAFGLPVQRLARELAQLEAGDTVAPLPHGDADPADARHFRPGSYADGQGSELRIEPGVEPGELRARSRRRYGVEMSCPLRRVGDQGPERALSLVLPEHFEAMPDGQTLRWTDAEGSVRELRRSAP